MIPESSNIFQHENDSLEARFAKLKAQWLAQRETVRQLQKENRDLRGSIAQARQAAEHWLGRFQAVARRAEQVAHRQGEGRA